MSSSQDTPRPRRDRIRRRVWREWCFVRAALRHFRLRFLVMGAVLTIGTLLFQKLRATPYWLT